MTLSFVTRNSGIYIGHPVSFLSIAKCLSLVEVRRFRGTCCIYYQGSEIYCRRKSHKPLSVASELLKGWIRLLASLACSVLPLRTKGPTKGIIYFSVTSIFTRQVARVFFFWSCLIHPGMESREHGSYLCYLDSFHLLSPGCGTVGKFDESGQVEGCDRGRGYLDVRL